VNPRPGIPNDDIGVCLLAGGEATRLPGKLALTVGDVPMLVHVYRNVSAAGPTWISTKDALPDEIGAAIDAPRVLDRWPKRGPLSGLLSTMSEMRSTWVFAVAGDAPFIDAAFARRLAKHIGPGVEAVVPMHGVEPHRIEPLAALYRRDAFLREGMPVLLSGAGALRLVIDRLETRFMAVRDERTFTNVNTPSEYDALREAPV
jgi:molybdopterin-guanine dinucleotide biosynthesis protein A